MTYSVPITVLKPQVVRKKQQMRAKGSALRRGGHKPLHLDELPVKETRRHNNSYGITEIKCNCKNFFKWAKKREGSVAIKDGEAVLLMLPLQGQEYKQVNKLIQMLRQKAQGKLMMSFVS